MKRTVFALLASCIIIFCCACGKLTPEEASAEADAILAEHQGEAACFYDSDCMVIDGEYSYCVLAFLDESAAESPYYEMMKAMCAQEVNGTLYPLLEPVLEKADMPLVMKVCDYKGNVFATIKDGEIEYH